MQIFTSPEIQNGELRYRIEMRQTPFGTWQQRHIWLAGPGRLGADDWIRSIREFDPAARGYVAMQEAA